MTTHFCQGRGIKQQQHPTILACYNTALPTRHSSWARGAQLSTGHTRGRTPAHKQHARGARSRCLLPKRSAPSPCSERGESTPQGRWLRREAPGEHARTAAASRAGALQSARHNPRKQVSSASSPRHAPAPHNARAQAHRQSNLHTPSPHPSPATRIPPSSAVRPIYVSYPTTPAQP
jgi:hypothetical protein